MHGLAWLICLTVASSVAHYVDNTLFFSEYPEPVWLNPTIVDVCWFVMTPLAWFGYRLMLRGSRHAASVVLLLYAGANLLTLGHYFCHRTMNIAPRIHGFILIEAILAVLLIIYVCLPYLKQAPNRQDKVA